MQIHTPTMLLVLSALCLSASLCHLVEWRNLRETALLYWSAGMGLIALAAATAPLRVFEFYAVAIGGANALLLAGYALLYVGFARFCDVKTSLWWYAGPVVWLLFYGLSPAAESIEARVAVISTISAFYSLAIALTLLNPTARSGPALILSAAFGAHGLFCALRVVLVGLPAAVSDQRLMTGFLFTLVMTQAILMIGVSTYLVIAMVRGRHEQSLRRLSETDFLTGIDNRRAFTTKATALLNDADAGDVALLLFDLDRFKKINDDHGHGCGDEVIKLFVDSTADHLRPTDVFARLGGEEFAALVRRRDKHEPAVIARAIVRGFANQARTVGGRSIAATVSAGVATNEANRDLNGLLTAADQALYRAKSMGRDRVEAVAVDAPLDGPPADDALLQVS